MKQIKVTFGEKQNTIKFEKIPATLEEFRREIFQATEIPEERMILEFTDIENQTIKIVDYHDMEYFFEQGEEGGILDLSVQDKNIKQ